jgi:hypothetical protein
VMKKSLNELPLSKLYNNAKQSTSVKHMRSRDLSKTKAQDVNQPKRKINNSMVKPLKKNESKA